MLMYLSMIETPDDKAKFERIYNRYRNLMYHVAYKVLGNHHDAEIRLLWQRVFLPPQKC